MKYLVIVKYTFSADMTVFYDNKEKMERTVKDTVAQSGIKEVLVFELKPLEIEFETKEEVTKKIVKVYKGIK